MVEEMNSSMTYLTYCKNLCKCHNVPPASTMTINVLKLGMVVHACNPSTQEAEAKGLNL
jgi:hypothetical protein